MMDFLAAGMGMLGMFEVIACNYSILDIAKKTTGEGESGYPKKLGIEHGVLSPIEIDQWMGKTWKKHGNKTWENDD